MDKEELINRLKKLKALAEGGVGGEAENADALLARIAKANGIDIDRIDEEKKIEFRIKLSYTWQKKLIWQLIGLVNNDIKMWNDFKFRRNKPTPIPRIYVLECTQAEWIEILSKFTVLERDYKRQLDAFYRAFLIRNDLLLPASDDAPEPTEEELRKWRDARRLSTGMERSQLHQQIEMA